MLATRNEDIEGDDEEPMPGAAINIDDYLSYARHGAKTRQPWVRCCHVASRCAIIYCDRREPGLDLHPELEINPVILYHIKVGCIDGS